VGVAGILFLVVIVVAAVVAGRMSVNWVNEPSAIGAEQNQKLMLQMVGLREPVTNRLDERFTDADGDLVADPPGDTAQLVDPKAIQFCYIPDDDEPEVQQKRWKPFIDHLARVTGKPVEWIVLDDSAAQLRALHDGKLHVTGLNTGAVPTAVNQCGFVPVSVLPSHDGRGHLRMRLIVPANSSIQSPVDLKGRELTLTEPGSNSGYKAPLVLLRSEFGLIPGRDFQFRYSLGHDQSIAGIAENRFEIAAVASDMLDRAVSRGDVKPAQFRSIYESQPFPTAGIGYVYNLNPEIAAKVREAIETFDWAGTPLSEQLGTAGGTKFIPAKYKDDWAAIRLIDDASGEDQAEKFTGGPTTRPD
jgi:phosphonate transport system substrate-binding protein